MLWRTFAKPSQVNFFIGTAGICAQNRKASGSIACIIIHFTIAGAKIPNVTEALDLCGIGRHLDVYALVCLFIFIPQHSLYYSHVFLCMYQTCLRFCEVYSRTYNGSPVPSLMYWTHTSVHQPFSFFPQLYTALAVFESKVVYIFWFTYNLDRSTTHPKFNLTWFEPTTSKSWTVRSVSLRWSS